MYKEKKEKEIKKKKYLWEKKKYEFCKNKIKWTPWFCKVQ
jgi:hypothetical protein